MNARSQQLDSDRWSEVLKRLKTRFPDCKQTRETARIDWSDGGSPPQRIVVLRGEVAGVACAILVGWIAAEGSLDPREALSLSGWQLGGGLVLRDGTYLFKLAVPIAALGGEALDAVIDLVARRSAEIRERAKPPEIDVADFRWAM